MDLSGVLDRSPLVAQVSGPVEACGVQAWLVGGTVRDLLLCREVEDVDIVADGDVQVVAKKLANAVEGDVFRLSDQFGGWRVIGPGKKWQADITPLRGGSIEADLALRDFTVNAVAAPLAGGEAIDPHNGLADLEMGFIRAVSERAFTDDPLRVIRLPRIASELAMAPEPRTAKLAAQHAKLLARVPGERVFYELRLLVTGKKALAGMELMDEIGATASVLPELEALKGIEQTPYHHLDAYGHTIEVLQQCIELERDLSPFAEFAAQIATQLARQVGDGLDAFQAMRFAALFHDIGKSKTRAKTDEGKVTFMGHDRAGRQITAAICRRLCASNTVRRYLEQLTLNHLRLGFLVSDEQPTRRQLYNYITKCEPYALEVTVLSVADRLSTRGERTKQKVIDGHIELARKMAGEVLEWRRGLPREPLVHGDVLAQALGLEEGPLLGRLLGRIDEAYFAAEIASREQALAAAPGLLREIERESEENS